MVVAECEQTRLKAKAETKTEELKSSTLVACLSKNSATKTATTALNVFVIDTELGELLGELAVVVGKIVTVTALQRDTRQFRRTVIGNDVVHVRSTVATDYRTHGIDVAEQIMVHHTVAQCVQGRIAPCGGTC